MSISVPRRRSLARLVAPLLLVVPLATSASAESVGIYLYENIEGAHTVSSRTGTLLASHLLGVVDRVEVADRVPLQSNETVRILEGMTEDRKVTVTVLSTWFSAGAVAAPTVTFADDSIKFRDLTWHVDADRVVEDARERSLTHLVIGNFTGRVRAVPESVARSGGSLSTVDAVGDVRLVDLRTGAVLWSDVGRETQAGFDPRNSFDDAASRLVGSFAPSIAEGLGASAPE